MELKVIEMVVTQVCSHSEVLKWTPNSLRMMVKDRMETTTKAGTEIKEDGNICKMKN